MSLPNRVLNPVWLDGSNPAFIFATDGLGRDILSRLIHASQMTLVVAVAAVLLGGFVGVTLGFSSGY